MAYASTLDRVRSERRSCAALVVAASVAMWLMFAILARRTFRTTTAESGWEDASETEWKAGRRVVLVTGAAGFVGFHTVLHTVLQLHEEGDYVVGMDNFNDYYDVEWKRSRARLLRRHGIPRYHSPRTIAWIDRRLFMEPRRRPTRTSHRSITTFMGFDPRDCDFFTVYGPMGRPDMAYFKFAEAIVHNFTIVEFRAERTVSN